MSPPATITIVSVLTGSGHNGPPPDLRDILACLGRPIDHWSWCLFRLDAIGPTAADICRRIESAGETGLWLTTEQLRHEALGIDQTIEGEFVAFPDSVEPTNVAPEEWSWLNFPSSRAELAIVAIDGTTFDILAKNSRMLTEIRRHWPVIDQPISNYFPALVPVS